MKNLKRVLTASYDLSILEGAVCYCVSSEKNSNDYNSSAAIYFYSNGIIKQLTEVKKELINIYNIYRYFGFEDDCKNKDLDGVSIEYQYLTKALIIALVNGDVLSLDLETNEMQFMGIVEGGLTAMEWSPDFETVAFVTGTSIILMTAAFEPIIEINLFNTGPALKEMVNVGWGKKETQFHGSEGKLARTAAPIQGSKEVDDDKKTRISWRGDSMLFVASVWSDESNERVVKIFNQEGVYQSHAQTLPGLEHSIAWRPSGSVIALTQKLPNKHIVSFVEKNGLIHGTFTLPSNIRVKELCWNMDSTILCIVCETKLLLYTSSNYHWYLKQQIDVSCSPVVAVRWDRTAPNVLYIIHSNKTTIYQWMWNISRTPSLAADDGAVVAVIDGCQVLVTSFKKKLIPPPMSEHIVVFPDPVNEIAFAPGVPVPSFKGSNCEKFAPCYNVNNFAAYLSNEKIVLVSNTIEGPTLSKELPVKNLEVECLHNFIWITPNTLLCCGIKCGGQYYICELNISVDCVTAKKHTKLEQPLLSLVPSYSSCSSADAMIQLIDGGLFKYELGSELVPLEVRLTEPCCELAVHSGNVISLSDLKRLYYNGDLFISKATSFFIMPPFLLVTTSEHTVLVYKFNSSKCDLISSRRLERGSKIITVVNDNIILQMPRGNLESIQPRALTMHTAAQLISRCEYIKVFGLLRKHRINMNLIVDHQPQAFLLTVSKFVQQISDESDLSLFLTELSDVDVTRTFYKDYYNQDERPAVLDRKIERVCQALRGVMITSCSETGGQDYLNPIITTYVKTNDMTEALKLASQSNKCLKHLLFLVDVDKLYNCALSLYNLDMALKIAEKSNRDPKEYVPYLNSLNKLDEDYMKFKIDCDFNKYESALSNISQSPNEEHFTEALNLIISKNLFPQALQLYKSHPERYKKVCDKFAVQLKSKSAYEEAGHMFTRCGMPPLSLNAYADAGLWRAAILAARSINYGREDINALAKHSLQVLVRKGLYGEAAELAYEILKDENLVIEYLVQGKLWNKAIYYASLSPRINVETAIMPFVREEAVSITEIMKENLEKLKKYSARLSEIRLQKLKKKENPISDIDISDIKSDISSVSSGFSSNTSRTGGTQSSKNTRKMQKKMWSLKEGNPREEFALLSVITQLIRDLELLTDDVSRSCSALLWFNDDDFDSLALNMQTSMKQALQTIQDIKNSVWPTQPNENGIVAANELHDAQLKFPPCSCVKPGWDSKILHV